MGTISLLPLDLPATLKIQKRGNFYLGISTNPDVVRHTPVFPERERQLLTSFPGLRYSSCLLLFYNEDSIQFSRSVVSDSATPWTAAHQASLSITKLPEFTQTHVHWVGDAIQPSHPLLSPSPALNLSQNQRLFKWVSSAHQVAEVLEFQPQHQSFQWTPRTDFL